MDAAACLRCGVFVGEGRGVCGECWRAIHRQTLALRARARRLRADTLRLRAESQARIRELVARMDLLAGGAARTPGLVRRSAFWPLTPAPPPLAGLRVLVVEDEPFVRDSTRLVLEDAGACVAAAADGLEALAILQYEQFDVILCDVLMPRLDGPAFVRHLRQERGQAAPPVIAVSAFASHWSPRQVQQAGFAGYLAKPFEIPALMGAIAAARSRPAA